MNEHEPINFPATIINSDYSAHPLFMTRDGVSSEKHTAVKTMYLFVKCKKLFTKITRMRLLREIRTSDE